MKLRTIIAGLVVTAGMTLAAVAGNGPPAPSAIWADGMAYRTVDTGNRLPGHGPMDGLYVFNNLEGQRPVAEAKPGDHDYNGGRWQVYVLEFTEEGLAVHDPDEDGVANFELTGWDAVQTHIGLGHLEMSGMGPRFVCPLIQ